MKHASSSKNEFVHLDKNFATSFNNSEMKTQVGKYNYYGKKYRF